MHLDMLQEPLYAELWVKTQGPEARRRLCGNLRSRSHFMRKFTGKMPGPRSAQKFTGKCRSPEPGCRLFVRACAVEMHLDISREPLYAEFYRKNAGAQNRGANCLCEPAQPTCTWRFHKSHFVQKSTGKMPPPAGARWSSTGLSTYRKKPSVRTHYLGNCQKKRISCT